MAVGAALKVSVRVPWPVGVGANPDAARAVPSAPRAAPRSRAEPRGGAARRAGPAAAPLPGFSGWDSSHGKAWAQVPTSPVRSHSILFSFRVTCISCFYWKTFKKKTRGGGKRCALTPNSGRQNPSPRLKPLGTARLRVFWSLPGLGGEGGEHFHTELYLVKSFLLISFIQLRS